jgi:dUTP pyrophosphatase
MFFNVELSSANAKVPTRGTPQAAGYDLYADQYFVVKARSQCLVSTGIKVSFPPCLYGRIAPRSGLALRHSIDVGAGVIDSDYRGEIKVLLFNHSNAVDFEVNHGDRIAQMILERIETPEVTQVESVSEEESTRGAMGFGSTGK